MPHNPGPPRRAAATYQQGFLAMLPAIRTHARIAFGRLDPEGREEAVQEAVCNALVAYARLFNLGKVALAYPSVLARFAVAQTRAFRKVGNRLNCKDVLSKYCQRQKGIVVKPLDKFDEEDKCWQEILIEDRRAGPAEVAATRLDFAAWLRVLPSRLIRIAKFLAKGETTSAAARKFGISAGRISQLRRELEQSWQAFQGDATAAPQPAKAA